MPADCNGICVRYKVKKFPLLKRYVGNNKRCTVCGIFIEWEGSHCPCCGYKLKTHSYSKKCKEKREKEITFIPVMQKVKKT